MKNILIRILAAVLVLTMVFAFVACQEEEPKDPVEDPKDPVDDPKDPVDDPNPEEKCPECNKPLSECEGHETVETCPDCGKPLDECECEPDLSEYYTPFTCPLSSSTVYGVTTTENALTFNDVWGSWEVVTEGENAGAIHSLPGTGACVALINNVDFKNAKKITFSVDVMMPANNGQKADHGLIFDVWYDKEVPNWWESEYCSYFLLFHSSNTGTLLNKLGPTAAGENEAWYPFNNPADPNFSYTWDQVVDSSGLEFNWGDYCNLKFEYDCENEKILIYYDDVLRHTYDFDVRIFANDGDNDVGVRSNRDDIYFKNFNLIVE